jgi:Fe2+ or Zn2+ uptake regulation protein
MREHPDIDILRKKGYRITPQRIAVLEILRNAGAHLTALEIYNRADKMIPGINEATIYRIMEIFSREGLVFVSHLDGSQIVYESGSKHHHIQCRICGNHLQIMHDVTHEIYAQLEQISGYQLDSSHLTFLGICPDCQRGDT